MKISQIILSKSKTIGILDQKNRTKFRKIQITASCDIAEGEDAGVAYKALSEFIEQQFEYEKNIK